MPTSTAKYHRHGVHTCETPGSSITPVRLHIKDCQVLEEEQIHPMLCMALLADTCSWWARYG